MNRIRRLLMLACLLQLPTRAEARYALPDLERVPIDRLIANLQRQVEQKPTDMQLR